MDSKTLMLASFTMASLTACVVAPAPGSTTGTWAAAGDPTTDAVTTAGSGYTPPPATPQGEKAFIDNVYPVLQDAQCLMCHAVGAQGAPSFMSGATKHDTYINVRTYRNGALIAPVAVNLILNKGDHEGEDLSASQLGIVKEWVNIENQGKDTTSQLPTLYDAIDSFTACMSFQQFQNQKLDTIFALKSNIGAVDCNTCHNQANVDKDLVGALLLNGNAQATFDNLKTFPAIFKLVSPAVATDTGAFKGLEASKRFVEKGKEFANCDPNVAINLNFNALDPTYCHPDYGVDQVLEDNINAYIDFTLKRSVTEICTPDNTK